MLLREASQKRHSAVLSHVRIWGWEGRGRHVAQPGRNRRRRADEAGVWQGDEKGRWPVTDQCQTPAVSPYGMSMWTLTKRLSSVKARISWLRSFSSWSSSFTASFRVSFRSSELPTPSWARVRRLRSRSHWNWLLLKRTWQGHTGKRWRQLGAKGLAGGMESHREKDCTSANAASRAGGMPRSGRESWLRSEHLGVRW